MFTGLRVEVLGLYRAPKEEEGVDSRVGGLRVCTCIERRK